MVVRRTIFKPRKPKPINFPFKKTFRIDDKHLQNLTDGAEIFQEDESGYIRILLQIDPIKIKDLLDFLECSARTAKEV